MTVNYNSDFQKFKIDCSKTGTTEESLAIAEKIGFKTDLLAVNPFKPDEKVPVYFANFVLISIQNRQNLKASQNYVSTCENLNTTTSSRGDHILSAQALCPAFLLKIMSKLETQIFH